MIIRECLHKDRNSVLKISKLFTLTPYLVDSKFIAISNRSMPILARRQFTNKNIKIFVAIINEQVVGYISLVIEKEFSYFISQRCASILFLAVDIGYQRKGIGGKLLDKAMEYCKNHGVGLVRVGTDDNNNAIHLYKNKGFSYVLEWDIYRIYKAEISTKKYNVLFYNSNNIDDFPMDVLLKRPIPWYYHNSISLEGVHNFLIKKQLEQFSNKEISWWKTKDNSCSLVLKRDRLREKYYGIMGTLWSLNDLSYKDERLATETLQRVFQELPQLMMAEYWVCRHDTKTISILKNAGMKKVYTGHSLIKVLK